MENKEKELQDLRDQNESLESKLADLFKQLELLQKENQELKKENHQLREKVNQFEDGEKIIDQALTGLEESAKQINAQVLELETHLKI